MIKKVCIIAIFAILLVFGNNNVNAVTSGEYMSEYLATVKYEQKNGFAKDKINDEYYSQLYSVCIDNVEIQSYKIDILEGFPEGTYVANADTGKKQEEFGINEKNFKIMVPINKAEDDFIGNFKAYMDFKTYITYYTNEGELMMSDVNDSNEQIIKFDNRHSILTINAIDAETLEGVSGVTIQVKDNTFNLTEELVTDRLGKAIVNKIGSGNASIKVTDVPNEYVITGIEELKEVEHNEMAEYNVELKRKKGTLRIENNAINSTFEIYNSKGNLVGKYSTDENGMIEIDELDVGNYLLIQKQTPKGYLPIENQIFTISEGRTCHLFITNEIEEVVVPNEDEQKGNEENKDLEDNKEPSNKPNENEQDKIPDTDKSNENEQDKIPDTDKPNENEQDKTPDTDRPNENEQDKTLETEKPHKRPHKHKLECKCECCKKEQVEKPKDEEQNENMQDKEIPKDNEDDKEVQDNSKEDSNKSPTIKGEENVSNDKDNNSKEQEKDNEKETENKVAENEEDIKTDFIDKQSNSNIDKANLSTLPRTGDDYFLVKLIIFDIFMTAIFLLILNYKKQSAKKQTALVSSIKE